MIEKESKEMSIKQQCKLINISRSSIYYTKTPFMERINADVVSKIVEIYEQLPIYGVVRTYYELQKRGYYLGRDRIAKIKKELNLRTFYPEPKTTLRNKLNPVYPYLLKGLKITRPNHVWATDITYIPLKLGFAYLVSIIDLYSRKILSWSLSNSLDKSFCIEALNEAIERYGIPEIFNTDQGCQFTSIEFTNILLSHNINISMDSKGRAIDNIYIERYWRTLKYEDIYLNKYETMPEARIGINRFTHFYNTQRLHSSLEYKTPDEIYYSIIKEVKNTSNDLVSVK
jgi:putative transposase